MQVLKVVDLCMTGPDTLELLVCERTRRSEPSRATQHRFARDVATTRDVALARSVLSKRSVVFLPKLSAAV